MRKIAVLFPGIGYTCDKPLLYYSWKMLAGAGWEVVPVRYGGFPEGVKGNPEKMREAALMALKQAEEQLRDVDWSAYADVLFVGKSVGTVVCTAYARQHGLSCRQVLFTPVEATFRFTEGKAIAFHGTADPWAETKAVTEACRKRNIPLYLTENANHSLETGNADTDIAEIRKVMQAVSRFIREEEE